MWVHFNFLCDANTQIRLHKIFRHEVIRWKGSLIDGCILTYYFSSPPRPSDSLYVCLNILSMNPSSSRSTDLSKSQRNRIPREILDRITELASKYLANPSSNLQIRDYEFDLRNPSTLAMYRASSTEEILNFASIGTEIALEILNDDRTRNRTWSSDKEIAERVIRYVNERLTTQNERDNGLHFVCNPLGLWNLESYLLGVMSNIIPPDGRALILLYHIEAM